MIYIPEKPCLDWNLGLIDIPEKSCYDWNPKNDLHTREVTSCFGSRKREPSTSWFEHFFLLFERQLFLRISHRAKRSISSTISNERWDKQICLESEHPLEKESSRLCWNRNFWFINALTALIRSQILDGSKSNIDLMTWGFAPPLI